MREIDSSDRHREKETAPVEQRVAALESALDARGLKPAEFIDGFERVVEDQWIPRNGARVVGRAWTDAGFRKRACW